MNGIRFRVLAGTGAAWLIAMLAVSPARPDGDLVSTRALVERLRATGRADAGVTVTLPDPLGGPHRKRLGRIALERPDRVRLDFPETGERIALRADGGEWIQPGLRQMVRLAPEQAGMAAWLWEVFLKGDGSAFAERAIGERTFSLAPRAPDTGLPEGIVMRLDRFGLPAELEFEETDGVHIRYRFERWRFGKPRGAKAFTLTAPRGYEIVDLP